MLALISAIDHFRVYLINNHLLVNTDHKALTWLKTIKHTNARLIRWAFKLQEFTFDLKHRPGAKHQNCDALSRRPYAENSQNDQIIENDNDLLPMDRIETTFIYENENPEEILQMSQEKSGKICQMKIKLVNNNKIVLILNICMNIFNMAIYQMIKNE